MVEPAKECGLKCLCELFAAVPQPSGSVGLDYRPPKLFDLVTFRVAPVQKRESTLSADYSLIGSTCDTYKFEFTVRQHRYEKVRSSLQMLNMKIYNRLSDPYMHARKHE